LILNWFFVSAKITSLHCLIFCYCKDCIIISAWWTHGFASISWILKLISHTIHFQHQLHFTTHLQQCIIDPSSWQLINRYFWILIKIPKFITIIHKCSLVFLSCWLLERDILDTNMSWNWMQSINYMKNFEHWYEILFLLAK
jgi:hypothetical protein